MNDIFASPLFGVGLSFAVFLFGTAVYRRVRSPFANPLLIAIVLIVALLAVCKIPLDSFNAGGKMISFFLSPATVILAVPLYRRIDLLKRHAVPIILGVVLGSVVSMLSIFLLCDLFHLDRSLTLSLVPKSVTAPIGIEISRSLGAVPAITIAAIVLTGVTGAVIAPSVMRLFRIHDEVAQGIAIGTAAHAVGTSKAVEMGETIGAMSGLAIGIAGITTVFLAPVFARIFH